MKSLKLFPIFLILISALSCSKKKADPTPTAPTTPITSDCFYSLLRSLNSYTPLTSPDGSKSPSSSLPESIPLSFPINLFGRTFNSISVSDVEVMFLDSSYTISGNGYDNVIGIIHSLTVDDYAYKTIGITGSRIFKLQLSYAGSSTHTNLQIWFYESSGNIEMRFGQNTAISPSSTYDVLIVHDDSGKGVVEGVSLSSTWNSPQANCYAVNSVAQYNSSYPPDNYQVTGSIQDGLTYIFTKLK